MNTQNQISQPEISEVIGPIDSLIGSIRSAGSVLARRLTLLLLLITAGLMLMQPCAGQSGTWTPAGSLNIERNSHTANLLPNGNVLVAGGNFFDDGFVFLESAELYVPATGTWMETGRLVTARSGHTATLLPNGNVLVAGGIGIDFNPLSSAELYDPVTGTWAATGSFVSGPRESHTATPLPDGKVLVAGGYLGGSLTSAELYDPVTGGWTATGSLNTARYDHTATLLSGGKVLVAAGYNGLYLASAELYDPATGTWMATGSLNTAHGFGHTATLLPSGVVLVAGGRDSSGFISASAELYDPATGTWAVTGILNTARYGHTATLLPGGKVIVAAGQDSSSNSLASAELYDPATGAWTATGSLNTARHNHTATLLPDGQVLAAAGQDRSGNSLASAELYLSDEGGGVILVSAASRLTHGSAGDFDINMPLSGVSGVEDRASDSYNAVFIFDAPATSGDVTIVSGTATVGAITFNGNEMIAQLTAVTDEQVVTLRAENVNGSGTTVDVPFGFLIADVDANRSVRKADADQIEPHRHEVVNGSNFRDDINLNGRIEQTDHRSVSMNRGHEIQ